MSRICAVSGKAPMYGHNVSHAENKTQRIFRPNLHELSFFSEILGAFVKLKVSSRGAKTIEKNGGIDAYVLGLKPSKLTPELKALKKRIEGAKAKKGVK
ncbi:MAG: 50S ribosomal protein L28 [Alphaproteobacteria bacterium]|nr:50S ribosomal protein L28 [Alphaproteobacteria bacterium]